MRGQKKNPGICGSTALPNVAYKRSWSEKLDRRLPIYTTAPLKQAGTPKLRSMSMISTRSRGALLRVIDMLRSFGSIPIMGADAPLFLKKGDSRE